MNHFEWCAAITADAAYEHRFVRVESDRMISTDSCRIHVAPLDAPRPAGADTVLIRTAPRHQELAQWPTKEDLGKFIPVDLQHQVTVDAKSLRLAVQAAAQVVPYGRSIKLLLSSLQVQVQASAESYILDGDCTVAASVAIITTDREGSFDTATILVDHKFIKDAIGDAVGELTIEWTDSKKPFILRCLKTNRFAVIVPQRMVEEREVGI